MSAPTNALALEHARQPAMPGRLWIVSKKQESGRGRRGRVWATPEGNLAATLLLVEPFDLALPPTLGFVAGLALADALDAVGAAQRRHRPTVGAGRRPAARAATASS